MLNARNPYDGTVYIDGKRYFWSDIAQGKKVEVKGVNTGRWLGLRSREPMPIAKEEPVNPISQDEKQLLDARNPYDGLVHMDGKKYFWSDIAKGKKVEVGGANTGRFIGLRSRTEPMPVAQEEEFKPFSLEDEWLISHRNPYDGHLHVDGKQYFWDAAMNGKYKEVGGVNDNHWNHWLGMNSRFRRNGFNQLVQRSSDDSESEPTFFDGNAWVQNMPASAMDIKPSDGPLEYAN